MMGATQKGLSFTLTVLVAALVLLATGFGLIVAFQGQMPVLSNWVNSGTSASLSEAELQQAKSNCELSRDRYCTGDTVGEDCPGLAGTQEWACRATYDGKFCYEYWEMEDNLGSIPHC